MPILSLFVTAAFAAVSYWDSVLQLRALFRSLVRHECYRCGYDLRGLPRPTVCPECGSVWSEAELLEKIGRQLMLRDAERQRQDR